MRRLRTAALLLLTGVMFSTPACGYGARKEQAKQLVTASSRIRGFKTASGKLTLVTQVKLPESIQRQQQQGGFQIPGTQQQQAISIASNVVIDFTRERAALFAGPAPESAIAVYDKTAVYLRRTGRGTERRPWVTLDFEDVNAREAESESNPPVGFLPVNPTVLVDLVAGSLSGSIKKTGTRTLEGTQVLHYTAKIDWEKMLRNPDRETAGLRELDDDRSEALQRIYESMQIRDTIFPAEIYVDDRGLPRRVEMTIEQRFQVEGQQQRSRRTLTETKVILDLDEFSGTASIQTPKRGQTIVVDTFAQLVREATRGLSQEQQQQGGYQLPGQGQQAQASPAPSGIPAIPPGVQPAGQAQ